MDEIVSPSEVRPMRFPARRAVLSGLGLRPARRLRQEAGRPDRAWERVKASKTLRIGLEGTYPPFNFQDKDGQLAGFEVDFAKALAAQLKV
jgi:cystine transport system substrate-binding protein